MGRTPCCEKTGLKKGPWTPEEDQKLIDYIQKNGCGNWRTLPKNAGLQRCGKSCRLRWTNYLRPDIKRGRFSFEEEETIIQLHSILGNKWSAIAARLPGRTDNEIKNYWNTHIRKRLLRMGIDPVTHSPRLDLLDLSSILNSSLYNSSQMNLSRLLGVQTLVNPEILRLATSLLSPPGENPNLGHLQNIQENNQMCNNPHGVIQNQLPPLIQSNQFDHPQNPIQEIPFASDHQAQLMEPNVEQFSPENFTNFASQSCQLNEWQNNGMACNFAEDFGSIPNYGYFGPTDPPPSENSNFLSNNSNNFSFGSVISTLSSTPTSSPAPMNSNEEERESYCSNMMMLKFEVPDIMFDHVNEFM